MCGDDLYAELITDKQFMEYHRSMNKRYALLTLLHDPRLPRKSGVVFYNGVLPSDLHHKGVFPFTVL